MFLEKNDFIWINIIELSIASNYFNKLYSRQFEGFLYHDDYLALANVGIKAGRYFFVTFLFQKAREEQIPGYGIDG